MDLERLSVRLRPRGGWESVDLGLALARTWWRPVYAIWLTLAIPLALLLVGLWGGRGLLLFWWLLPLCESVVLFTLSQAVFGSAPSWKETLRAAPGLWRRSAGELLSRRLHPTRVLYLPLGQLEGLRGKQRRQRATALAAGQDVSGMLVIAFLVFELGLWLAVIVFAMMMTPGWMGIDWGHLTDRFFDGTLARSGYFATSMLAVAAVLALHPLYVSAGFAIYLGRRTELEGWDLEIDFRRLARRMKALRLEASGDEAPPRGASGPADAGGSVPAKPGGPESAGTGAALASALAIALASSLALAAPGLVQAQDDPSVQAAPPAEPAAEPAGDGEVEQEDPLEPGVWAGDPQRDPRRLITEVMSRPELQREKKVVRWRLREDLFADRAPDSSSGPSPVLIAIVRIIAAIGEPLLWLAAAVGLGLLLRAAWKRLPEAQTADRDRKPLPPERLFGLDLRPESLPDDVPGDAEALWRAGRHAAALSLLYRGALGRLAAGGLELRASFTEDDCLRAAGAGLEPRRQDFFTDLTRAWQSVAYAHRVPEGSRASRLMSGWAEHFGDAL